MSAIAFTLPQQVAWLEHYTASRRPGNPHRSILDLVDELAEECYQAGEIRLGVLAAWLSIFAAAGILAPVMAVLIERVIAPRADLRAACLPPDPRPRKGGHHR